MNSRNQAKKRRDYNLRDWLERLDKTDRLAILKPGTVWVELTGIANRLDGTQATYFPQEADGHDTYPSFRG